MIDLAGTVSADTVMRLSRVSQTQYDALGRAIKSIYPDGTVEEQQYDELGNRGAAVSQYDPGDPNLDKSIITTSYEYDINGQLTAVILPPVKHPESGLMARPRYEYEYDEYGNQTIVRDNVAQYLDGTIVYDHDATNPGIDSRETEFTYDEHDRQVERKLPAGETESWTYDNKGRLDEHTSFEGVVAKNDYDELGRVKELVYNGGPEKTVTKFDGLGRDVTIVQENWNGATNRTEARSFDVYGRLEQVATEEGPKGIVNYIYDNAGRIKTVYTEDDSQSSSVLTELTYGYDALGRLIEVAETVRHGVELESLYSQYTDLAGELSSDPLAQTTRYQYDPAGNLGKEHHFTVELDLDPGSGLAQPTQAVVITDYRYDDLNRLTRLAHFESHHDAGSHDDVFNGNDKIIAEFEYQLAVDGKRTSAREYFATENQVERFHRFDWDYDAVGRLIRETSLMDSGDVTDSELIQADTAYHFDLVGNRVERVIDRGVRVNASAPYVETESTEYHYDKNDRLKWEKRIHVTSDAANEIDTVDDTTVYQYGTTVEATQLTSKKVYAGDNESGSGTALSSLTYTYNLQGRQATVAVDGAPPTTYRYNSGGIRVQKIDSVGAITNYVIDGNNHTGYSQIIEERDGNNVLQRSYTIGLDVVSQADDAPDENAQSFGEHFLKDVHGSTRALLEVESAKDVDGPNFHYDGYGNLIDFDLATAPTSILYSGEYTDLATGQQYLRARYYDPANGRFNRLDPFGGNNEDPLSLHKYLYVHGDPVQLVDPTGLFAGSLGVSVSIGIGIGGAIGGIDAALGGGGVTDVLIGIGAGAVLGGVAGAAVYLLPGVFASSFVFGFNLGFSLPFIADSFAQGKDKQGYFRIFTGLLVPIALRNAAIARLAAGSAKAAQARISALWQNVRLRANASPGDGFTATHLSQRVSLSSDVRPGRYLYVVDDDGRMWLGPINDSVKHSSILPKGGQARAAGHIRLCWFRTK